MSHDIITVLQYILQPFRYILLGLSARRLAVATVVDLAGKSLKLRNWFVDLMLHRCTSTVWTLVGMVPRSDLANRNIPRRIIEF